MDFKLPDLTVDHDVVKASRLMLDLYSKFDGAATPCELVLKAFPNLSVTQVMCLWVGVNITHWSEDSLNQVELVKPKLD